MNFLEMITGSDIDKEFKAYKLRVKKLPPDYQAAWEQICTELWPQSDFTGRNIMTILSGVIELFEETSADGQSIKDILGDDIKGFSMELIDGNGVKSYRDKWRDHLNRSIDKKLKSGGQP